MDEDALGRTDNLHALQIVVGALVGCGCADIADAGSGADTKELNGFGSFCGDL